MTDMSVNRSQKGCSLFLFNVSHNLFTAYREQAFCLRQKAFNLYSLALA